MEPNVTLQHQPSSDTIGNAFKWPAILVSYLFHPVLVPLYCIAFIVYIHPSYFTGFSGKEKIYTLLISAVNLVFFPLLTVLLLKALGFISSIYMHSKKDRIIPYIACSIFYFWAYLVFRNQTMYPLILPTFIFGMFLFLIPYCMGGIAGPALQSIIASKVPNNEQGEIQGALTGIMSLTSIVGPPLMTGLFAYFTKPSTPFHFSGVSFLLGALLMLVSVIVTFRTLHKPQAVL